MPTRSRRAAAEAEIQQIAVERARARRYQPGLRKTRTFEPRTIRPGVRIAFVRGPQNVSIEILDRDVA